VGLRNTLCQVKVCPEGEPKSEVPEKVMNKNFFLFLLKGSSLQEANHWHKLAWDTGQVHTCFFFLSSTKYKMQDPIEVPLLPIVAETVSHTMYCRAGGGKSEVVVLLEPYSPLSTSNDVWLHQGLPHS